MNSVRCPGCGTAMERKLEADLVTEVCPGCAGISLDKGELNSLATGMAGDIEYCSIDDDPHQDRYPDRICPKCDDQNMRKINLLRLSDVIFDFCPNCEGLFLDKDEVEVMNAELEHLSGQKGGEELREYRDGRLVRIDRLAGTVLGIFDKPVNTTHIRVAVYYGKSLNLGLRIVAEPWTAKLTKVFGLFKGQDIATGNPELDKAFIIQGKDEERIRKLLSSQVIQQALLGFSSKPPRILLKSGRLEVLDFCVAYTEGPYSDKIETDLCDASTDLIERMLRLAALLETSANP